MDFSRAPSVVDADLAAVEYKDRMERVVDRVMGMVAPACGLTPAKKDQLRKRLLDDPELRGFLIPPASSND